MLMISRELSAQRSVQINSFTGHLADNSRRALSTCCVPSLFIHFQFMLGSFVYKL